MEGDCDFSAETKSNAIAALNVGRQKETRYLGVALIDVESFKIRLCEFRDDTNFTLLEAALLQTRPVKCVVKWTNENLVDQKKLQNVFTRCGVTLLQGTSKNFSEAVEIDEIQRLLRESDQARFLANDIQQLHSARQSLRCALKESEAAQDGSLYHQFSLEILSINKFMRLDKAAFSALNLLPTPGERLKCSTSLLGFLNRCRTQFGQSRLISWITQPSLDITDINERHNIVSLFTTYADLRRTFQQNHLRLLPNFDVLATKFHKAALKSVEELSLSICSLEDIHALHEGLLEVHGALAVLELLFKKSEMKGPSDTLEHRFLVPLKKALEKFRRFHDLINYTLDPSEIIKGQCVINRTFDPELKELGDKKDAIWKLMEKHRIEVEDELGLTGNRRSRPTGEGQAVKIVECNSLNYVLRVSKKDQRSVQNNKTRYEQVRINKAEFQFTTKKFAMLAGEYRTACDEFTVKQRHLAQKTVATASTYWPVIESVADVIGALDILAGFAEIASTAMSNYVRPIMHGSKDDGHRIMKLSECRHPLVEQQIQLRRSDSSVPASSISHFIANSIDMETPHRLLNIITGPNMGGKSTYIRQIAISCLMAQIGSFVPCASAELSLIDSILCRVGASDDQLRGVSTFLAEMIEATAIIKSATESSLVLIDELGRGTSTFEGFGLAWEIARYLATNVKSFTLFATHFHELGELEKEVKGVFNSQVTASIDENQNHLVFLFGVKPGCADLSYGVRVARMSGLDPSIVERAAEKAGELEVAEKCVIGNKRESCTEMFDNLRKIIHIVEKDELNETILMNTCFEKTDSVDECDDEVEAFVKLLVSL